MDELRKLRRETPGPRLDSAARRISYLQLATTPAISVRFSLSRQNPLTLLSAELDDAGASASVQDVRARPTLIMPRLGQC